ncbi:MAG: aminotransferase class I/II-fold pyridoxal phosphate-dependent enzyme [Pseudomonadota bacterium]
MRDDADIDDLNFISDNAGPVHPAVIEAIAAANRGRVLSYGSDAWSARAIEAIRAAFEAPEAEVLMVPSGIAANALALSCLLRPWSRVFCARIAHIEMDEAGAVSLASGGAEPSLVASDHGRMSADALDKAIASEVPERRGAVTVTQATEAGTVYSLAALRELAGVARAYGLPVHMDGARWPNAAAHLGCSLADMTWRAGIDVLSLGGTKNGLMGAEAVVFFAPAHAAHASIRRQRMGLMLSKARYIAAQHLAHVQDGLWRELATAANAAAARLADGLAMQPKVEVLHPVEANMIFARFPRSLHRKLHEAGATYAVQDRPELSALEGPGDTLLTARFVCDWSTDSARVDRLISCFG